MMFFLVDASWFVVCTLFSCNLTFNRQLLVAEKRRKIFKQRLSNFPTIKAIRGTTQKEYSTSKGGAY